MNKLEQRLEEAYNDLEEVANIYSRAFERKALEEERLLVSGI